MFKKNCLVYGFLQFFLQLVCLKKCFRFIDEADAETWEVVSSLVLCQCVIADTVKHSGHLVIVNVTADY